VAEFQKIFADFSVTRGMVPIGYHVYDHQSVVFKAPVTNLAGFVGKRTRVLASETEQASLAALGAAPVPMSLPEVVPALQQGTIDAVSSALPVYVAFRYYDVAPNVVDTALWMLTSTAMVSKVFYDTLPADLQKIVVESGARLEPAVHKWQIDRVQSDRKLWAERGGKAVKLSAAEQADAEKRVMAAVRGVLDRNQPSKELYEKLKAIADKIN
jgi:TRAP-type C4-dicarboxylate transport system substrate-binding protein